MNEETRRAADDFLRETYGFDAATREAILDRGAADIARNCRELRLAVLAGAGEPARRVAHRLKGNLRALGLSELAGLARIVEGLADGDAGEGLEAAVLELGRILVGADFPA
jgi:HPt (histidine-containing phosphotransfer) domain-containing protein